MQNAEKRLEEARTWLEQWRTALRTTAHPVHPLPSADAPEPCVRRCHIPPATAGCLDFVYGTIMDYYVAFALLGILGKVTFSLPNNWDCLTHVDSNVSK
jgi:hypothetical protein